MFLKSPRPALCNTDHPLTSQVLDEVLQLHLPLGLDVGAVHVRVQEDDGERQDEDGVWILELPDQHWVAYTVPLTTEKEREIEEMD